MQEVLLVQKVGEAAESGESVKPIEFVEYHVGVQPVEANLSDGVREVEDTVEEVNAYQRAERRRKKSAAKKKYKKRALKRAKEALEAERYTGETWTPRREVPITQMIGLQFPGRSMCDQYCPENAAYLGV